MIVGLLALVGTCFGSLSGVLAANRLANYRISQLEEKVDKHNCLIDRMYKVESLAALISQRLSELEERKGA